MHMKIGFIEIFLAQIIIYTGLWIWDDFIGLFMSITFSIIASCILIVSLIAELIERSKVPKVYFLHMIGAILAPLLMMLLFFVINGGLPDLSELN